MGSFDFGDFLGEFLFFLCDFGDSSGVLFGVVSVALGLFADHAVPVFLHSQGLDLLGSVVVSVFDDCRLLLDVGRVGEEDFVQLDVDGVAG